MSSKILTSIVQEAFFNLTNGFDTSTDIFKDKGKLFHPGEFGKYREEYAIKTLKLLLPNRLGIGSGFIITNTGEVSTQCDIIIFDVNFMPDIKSNQEIRFFPVEAVVAIGEIKSDIQDKKELNNHLYKLAKVKELREKTKEHDVAYRWTFKGDYDPIGNQHDQLFTFLICNRFAGFNPTSETISYSDEILPRHRHNLVLSLHDGLFSYQTPSGKTKNLCFPISNDVINNNWWLPADNKDFPTHTKIFAINFSNTVTTTTVLYIDQTRYLSENIKEVID